MLGASESQQCFDNNDSIQASSEAPKQAPICYMGEFKKTNLKKKACIRLLLKNLSALISLTRLHSQRACQLAWYAFSSLGTTSAGLGSNEKKKKQQNKYTNQNLY